MEKIYGYARVSTPRQNIHRQIENIHRVYPNATIYQDEWTGKTMHRKGWELLMSEIINSPHCTLVFDEVSRMSRNANEGFQAYINLMNMGVDLVFLKEPYINTCVYKKALQDSIKTTGNEIADIYIEATNKLLKLLAKRQIELAFESAQKEVDYLRKRTKEGLRIAKESGKQIGAQKGRSIVTQKEKRCRPEIRRLSRDFEGSNTDLEVIKILGIDKNTFYKYKRKLIRENTT